MDQDTKNKIFVIAKDADSFTTFCIKRQLNSSSICWVKNYDDILMLKGTVDFANGYWQMPDYSRAIEIIIEKFRRKEITLPGWWLEKEGFLDLDLLS